MIRDVDPTRKPGQPCFAPTEKSGKIPSTGGEMCARLQWRMFAMVMLFVYDKVVLIWLIIVIA
jgi:hypothetical protein